jgi:4-hydroxy-tetrahydrodipicolinate synthase
MNLKGSMTALVTPFSDGEVDCACMSRLVERQIAGGTDWLVPLGTTGETPVLSQAEREQVLEGVLATANKRRPVMAGTGTNCTKTTVEHSRRAAAMGADALLVVVPYYNRPSQEGMYRHFAAVAESVDLPVVLYNVPARTGATLSNETIARLRTGFANIVAIKDATGTVDALSDLLLRCDIRVLAGDDTLTWPMMALGAVGVVSVISNLRPSWMKALVSAALAGDSATALMQHRRVCDLACGIGRFGPNPIPVKTAMAIVGLIAEEFRLPLCPLDAEARSGIEKVLRRHEMVEACAA